MNNEQRKKEAKKRQNANRRQVYAWNKVGKAPIWYVRLPMGLDTCSHCLMLAAVGPMPAYSDNVDWIAATHPSCQCIVVQVYGPEDWIDDDPRIQYAQDRYNAAFNTLQQEYPDKPWMWDSPHIEAEMRRQQSAWNAAIADARAAVGSNDYQLVYQELTRKGGKGVYDKNGLLNETTYNALVNAVIRKGGVVIRGTEYAEKHLDDVGAEASHIGDVILFRKNPTISAVLEETYHFGQTKDLPEGFEFGKRERILLEIDAQEWLLSQTAAYGIPENEVQLTKLNLEMWKQKLIEFDQGEQID